MKRTVPKRDRPFQINKKIRGTAHICEHRANTRSNETESIMKTTLAAFRIASAAGLLSLFAMAMAHAGPSKILYNFSGKDGLGPTGMASGGGSSKAATVLHSFSNIDGNEP